MIRCKLQLSLFTCHVHLGCEQKWFSTASCLLLTLNNAYSFMTPLYFHETFSFIDLHKLGKSIVYYFPLILLFCMHPGTVRFPKLSFFIMYPKSF